MPDLSTTTLERRDFQSRATAQGRTITAIGVPYDQEVELFDGWRESFAPGSVEDQDAILRYGHREPIGKITQATDAENGRRITGTVSATARGDEVVTLVADGVLTKMSIGFYPITWETTRDEDGTTHIRHTKVHAVEYSVVEFPAYDGAAIDSIRSKTPTPHKETTMPEATLTRADLDAAVTPITQSLDDLDREVKMVRSHQTTAQDREGIPFQFRSMGEYLKALAGKLDRTGAHEMATRAYEGAVLGDTVARPGWLGSLEKRITLKQEVTNLFLHTTDLPAEGMTVEYAAHDGDSTVKVGEQAAEGDALTTGKPAKYTTKSAPVKTYGGIGELSIQAIERASISLLDDLLYDQALEYGRRIETATRTLFTTTVTANEATPIATFAKLSEASVNNWIDALLALIDAYDDTPYVMDGIAVSPDVFKSLAHLDRSPKALQFNGAPTDHQGTITLATGSASFAELTVKRIPKWVGLHATGYAREAIRIKEAPGAPLRLQDTKVPTLTKEFAVYGYAAHFAPKTGLLKPIKITAA